MKPESPRKACLNPVTTAVILVVLAGLVAAIYPVFLKQRKAADRTTALGGLKQISTMLFEFDSEYGRFPDDETALEVKRRNKTDFTLTGRYSNDYFRQLLVGGGGKSEKPFWCKTAQSPRRNRTDDFSTAARAFEAGEVGYSYIMASATRGQDSSDEPSRPVVVTPSYKFQADWTFDPEPYAGKAVVLRLDNSATPMQVQEDNKVSVGQIGKTLGDVGEGTVWGTEIVPVLRAPQPR